MENRRSTAALIGVLVVVSAACGEPDGPAPVVVQQSDEPADLGLAQRVRQALMTDESLSTEARNVEVVGAKGGVTLRGPVRSEAERDAVVKRAQQIAGVTNVVNHLELAGTDGKPEQAR